MFSDSAVLTVVGEELFKVCKSPIFRVAPVDWLSSVAFSQHLSTTDCVN